MSSVRQSLRAAAVMEPDPVRMLRAGDSIVRALRPDLFVTAFVGIVDPVSLDFTFACAGHPPPLVRRADGEIHALASAGLPLGIFDLGDQVGSVEQLELGSTLVLYTDGLTEFDRDAILGERLLVQALRESNGERTAHTLYQDIVGQRARRDDVAILSVRFDLTGGQAQWSFDPSDASTARAVRAEIAETLAGRYAGRDVTSAELAVSELIGNVVQHTAGRVKVFLDVNGPWPTLHVVDRGPQFEVPGNEPPDVWSERGRGLFIVRALVRDLAIVPRAGGGNHVRVTLAG
jgi:anti-sigma regulatory factor (Ser/Thr protein kinase)